MHDIAMRIDLGVSQDRVHLVDVGFAEKIQPDPAPDERPARGEDRRLHASE
jgi:hypothetical protein